MPTDREGFRRARTLHPRSYDESCRPKIDVQLKGHPEERRILAHWHLRSRLSRFFACGLRMTPISRDASVVGQRRGQLRWNAYGCCRRRWLDGERAVDVAVFVATLGHTTGAGFDEAGDVAVIDGDGVVDPHSGRRDRVCGAINPALPAFLVDSPHLADDLWEQPLWERRQGRRRHLGQTAEQARELRARRQSRWVDDDPDVNGRSRRDLFDKWPAHIKPVADGDRFVIELSQAAQFLSLPIGQDHFANQDERSARPRHGRRSWGG